MLCEFGKRKLQSTDNQLTAILLCCLGRIRTLTGGTRIRRATITPQGIVFCFCAAKLCTFFVSAKFFSDFFIIKLYARYYSAIYQPYIYSSSISPVKHSDNGLLAKRHHAVKKTLNIAHRQAQCNQLKCYKKYNTIYL